MSEIIAKAMNSTLGTSGFKSFDEIFLSERCLAPSNDVITLFPVELQAIASGIPVTTSDSAAKSVARFVLPMGGAIKIKYRLGSSTSGSNIKTYLLVYVGGVLQTTDVNSGEISVSNERSCVIKGKKGDVVELKARNEGSGTNDWGRLNLYSICGSVINMKPMSMEVLA
jgi:hypothetical protein